MKDEFGANQSGRKLQKFKTFGEFSMALRRLDLPSLKDFVSLPSKPTMQDLHCRLVSTDGPNTKNQIWL
jgi:hypothetical protein